MKTIAVISDLHIGHNSDTHQLGHTDPDFASFLYYLENNYDKIILLGDIYEIEMAYSDDEEATFKEAISEHITITKRFQKDKYIYIFGNHDLVGEKFGGIERFEIDSKYIFLHGHQFDELHKEKHVKFFGSLFLKLNLKNVYRWFTEHINFGKYYSTHVENEKFESKVIEYAKQNNYSHIITGHSHLPKVYQKDNVMFINSGTCTYNRFCYVHMDLINHQYEIRTY